MRPSRIGILHSAMAIFAIAVIAQLARLQLLQGETWRARAAAQQYTRKAIPAPRGAILDASGRVLADSREEVKLEVAPNEIRDRAALRRELAKAGLARGWIARVVDTTRKWVTLPGRYVALDVARLTAMRGVYATPIAGRTYAISPGTRAIIGRVDANGEPVDGLELSLDSVLKGDPGVMTLVRDVRGRSVASPTMPGTSPRPGHTVVLTINQELQEIAERALADAVAKMNADGGDIVILDPHLGEVRALASWRAGARVMGSTAITEPFEPGSTMKPFMAAGLLARHKVTDRDSVDTGNGVFEINGRSIHDEHLVGRAPLSEVLRWSSNIGIVKFSQRFTPREQFETLRDFGFGTATGVQYPSESNGILREPSKWSSQSAASLAIGYEISATPLQLATAYAALANGGRLLEPTLVKEVRSPSGDVVYRHEPRVVRQVVPREVADKVRGMLLDVVEQGTALKADIANYLLAGKTGTPRRTVAGRYESMQYNPNFVGLFPGDAPQYVIVVKLTNPKGTFYGGTTAAPVTKAVLEAAIAARDAALDRAKLASSVRPSDSASPVPAARVQVAQQGGGDRGVFADTSDVVTPEAVRPFAVTLPLAPETAPPAAPRAVPDVGGLSLRDAVRSLHSAGFRVQLVRASGGGGSGAASTSPAAGVVARPGSLIRLQYDFR
jgi:cell division protein FtsI (penicillin-binding protein 3)